MIRLRLREVVDGTGLTRREFARRAGLPEQSLSRLIRFQHSLRRLDLNTLNGICHASGCVPEQLFDYVPDPPPACI